VRKEEEARTIGMNERVVMVADKYLITSGPNNWFISGCQHTESFDIGFGQLASFWKYMCQDAQVTSITPM